MLLHKIITPATAQVLTLAEAKKHLQIDASFTDDDALINAIIAAVRKHTEEYLGRFLLPTVVEQYYDGWNDHINERRFGGLVLFFTPVSAVASVKYFDVAGVEQTLATDQYNIDTAREPSLIRAAWNVTLPSLRGYYNDVTVRYTAGYANAASVPEPIKQAMLLMITGYYEHRDDTVKRMPTSSEYLLRNYRVQWLW